MTRILVTGEKGFIGSHAVRYFKTKGYSTKGINIDVRNKEALTPFFSGVDFVIHAAAKVKKGIPHPEDYYPINVLGTKNVVELCIENNCKLIHLGSVATEGLYGASKQESQKLVEEYMRGSLKAIILRLCVIYDKSNDTGRRGARYPAEKLMEDIENIIKTHNFDEFKIADYSNARE